jgi:3-dehydro-L-gulonate 2-dehydrogenase
MIMRIPQEVMTREFERILASRGLSEVDAREAAGMFTDASLDGVYSHGVNRFARIVTAIEQGIIQAGAEPFMVSAMGAFERWDGNLGMGNLNARAAMGRAVKLAGTHGIGLVAMANTNHWLRGGAYGWQAADAGCVGICWTNTLPNMPAWGAMDNRIGNNPFVLAVPRSTGRHVVLDMAMAQFSYGKLEETRLKGMQLPLPGGYDTAGQLTTDPAEIEKTGRVLPIGFWKGAGMAMALDLIAALLSAGSSTTDIGRASNHEYRMSQVFIAIAPGHFNTPEFSDQMIDTVLEDVKASIPAYDGAEVRYPGERAYHTRLDNMKNGIPVLPAVWDEILAL